jgi:hypothetical protein
MLKRRKPEKTGIRKPAQLRSSAHLQWVRGHMCAIDADGCEGRIEAAHIRIGTDGGMGVKPSDNYTVPLCHWHHAQQHTLGERSFEALHRISMLAIAEDLARRSPALVRNAIAEDI